MKKLLEKTKQRKYIKENSKIFDKKDNSKGRNKSNITANKELHYVVKLHSEEENNDKRHAHKEKNKDQKRRKNKRRSLSLLTPNYEKDIINNIKLADKLYKLTIDKNRGDSDNSNDVEKSDCKYRKGKKNSHNEKKIYCKNRRSLSCNNYDTDTSNSAKKNKKFDININEIQTNYKNKNIKIIYDDGYSKKIILRKKKKKGEKNVGEKEGSEKYKYELRHSDEKEEDQTDENEEVEEDDNEEEEEDYDDEDEEEYDDEEEDEYDDEEEEEFDDGEEEMHDDKEVYDNGNADEGIRKIKKKNYISSRKREGKKKTQQREGKKKIIRNNSAALSDSYFFEKRKKNVRKKKGAISTNKSIGGKKKKKRKERSESIDRTKKENNNYGRKVKNEKNSFNSNINERRNVGNKSNFEELEMFNRDNDNDKMRRTLTYQHFNTTREVNTNFIHNIKDIISKMHLNLKNIKETIRIKNDYIRSLFDSSYRNVIDYVKRNEIKKDNFYKIIFHDLFNLLNEFIMVDEYTKKFFFSIETNVRQRCLENIKNEFYNFINRYLQSAEGKNIYNLKCVNELPYGNKYASNHNNTLMHTSDNKRTSLYSTLSFYNSRNRKGSHNISGSNNRSSYNINSNNGSGNNICSNNTTYDTGEDRGSCFHLNSLHNNEHVKNELLKIEGIGDDLVLKVKKSNIFQNCSEQEDTLEYLKSVIKSEKEKNIKLELQYDELKQKYSLLKKKREEDILNEVHLSHDSFGNEDNFYNKFYRSKSILKLEEKKLGDCSQQIVDESVRLHKIKQINEQNKKELENDMNDIETKKKEIELEQELIKMKKKDLEQENSLLLKNRKEIEDQNDLIKRKNKEIEEETNLLNERRKEMEEEQVRLDEKKKEMEDERVQLDEKRREAEDERVQLDEKRKNVEDERVQLDQKKKEMENENIFLEEKKKEVENENILLNEKKKQVENENILLNEKKKEVENENILLNEKKNMIQKRCTLIEEELIQMLDEKNCLEERIDLMKSEEHAMKEKNRENEKEVEEGDDKISEHIDGVENPVNIGKVPDSFVLNNQNLENLKSFKNLQSLKNLGNLQSLKNFKDFQSSKNLENSESLKNNNITKKRNENDLHLTLDRFSTEHMENASINNMNNLSSKERRHSILSRLGSKKYSVKDGINNKNSIDMQRRHTQQNYGNEFTNEVASNNEEDNINTKNSVMIMLKKELVEREELLLDREEKMNDEKAKFQNELNELNILKEDISRKIEIIELKEEQLNKREEELKIKEMIILSKEKEIEEYSLKDIEHNNKHSAKKNSMYNSEMANILGTNSLKHFERMNDDTDLYEMAKSNNICKADMDNLENLRNELSNSKNCALLDYHMNEPDHNEIDLNDSTKNICALHFESSNNHSRNKNMKENSTKLTDYFPLLDNTLQNSSVKSNVDSIKEYLNKKLIEIEKYKKLLKSRDLEISSLKTEVEKLQKEKKWTGDGIYEFNNSMTNSKKDNSPFNKDNTEDSLMKECNYAASLQDSGNNDIDFSSEKGSVKPNASFLDHLCEMDKQSLNITQLNTQEKIKNMISNELITVYKEISNIKEEYNTNVLKKNEFIGALLLKFFNDLRNNCKLKENYYQKESKKSHALISGKECYIKELKSALQEKKIKEVSYKKMLLKMNQINDSYKLKNKRSLSTVEMLKQDIRLLSQDVLKKKEMIKKFEVSQ
ncbi:conserved Plasmodium protein, unknown function [Plasmodium malariae]|uniref:Uncharacterized protein n=1 Tax=Plasmodium malariae TaxID=5858 RepID=A0A1C3KDI1_PLAMA|nr:conserved Plasmodium protein, unknown function [Plasmodium malariae]